MVTDTSDKPRQAVPIPGTGSKLTDKEMVALFQDTQAVVANSGTYELKGSTLMIHPAVAKYSATMSNKIGQAFEFKLDGPNLWLTQTIGPTGEKSVNPTTVKLVRAE